MKATKRNIYKNENYKEVVKIRELIEKAIPDDANTRDMTEALLAELVDVMAFFHRRLGRDMGRGVYEYCVKRLEDGYNDILKEEEHNEVFSCLDSLEAKNVDLYRKIDKLIKK